jgi:Cu/Ag efflux protein CusF
MWRERVPPRPFWFALFLKTGEKMKVLAVALSTIALLAAPIAFAQNQPQGAVMLERTPGGGAAFEAIQLQGKVKSIDRKARKVVVVGPNGNEMEFVLGDEARNFDQIKKGDLVTLSYTQALALELRKVAADGVKRVDSESAVRSKEGEKPGVALERKIEVTASVVAVNPQAQTVTLRGPKRTVDLRINDPAELQNIKVGDFVEAVYVEAIALTVTEIK